MGSSWKLVLVFSVIFLTGALCGWLVTSSMGPKRPTPNPTRNFHTWSEDLAERIEKNGALTDSERELVRPRLEEAVRKMQEGNQDEARALLLEVIARTPNPYRNEFEQGENSPFRVLLPIDAPRSSSSSGAPRP